MCAAANLSAFAYWPGVEPHGGAEGPLQPYAPQTFLQDGPKSKFFRQSMLFFNNIAKQELFADRAEEALEMDSKCFLPPLNPLPVQETDSDSVQSTHELLKEKQELDVASEKARPYFCVECGKSFLLKHHLTTHARTHSGVRPHACNHCGKTFTHKHCLNTHLLLHSSERPFQCLECKKSFTLKHHLMTHTKVHSREKPFVCEECGQAFPVKRHLTTHSKFHAGERPYVCEDCGESFAQKDHLVMHSRFHGSLNSFVCPDCGATFTRKFELVNHGRLHGREPHTCIVCSKEFFQKRTLLAHMRCHTADFPLSCTSCGETFQSRLDLANHTKSAHTGQGQGHIKQVCQDCGCVFNTPEALALHVKLHSGDSQLVSDLCILTSGLQASFHPSAILPNNNNNNTSPNPANTTTTTTINTIITNSTGSINSIVAQQKLKNFVCPHCSKGYSARQGLQQHAKKHPEGACAIRSHICDTCSKAFFQKNHLLLHQRQHMDPAQRAAGKSNSLVVLGLQQEHHLNQQQS